MENGYLFDSSGQKKFTISKDIKIRKYLQEKYNNVNHERNHTFRVERINIGVIYGMIKQSNPLVMLKNSRNNVSKNFKEFLRIMDILEYEPIQKYTISIVVLKYDITQQYQWILRLLDNSLVIADVL